VQQLLETKANLNLHPNFAEGHHLENFRTREIAVILLRNVARIRTFHSNVEEGHNSAVALAIDNGMNTDVPGGEYKYALHTAAAFGNLTTVSLLLEKSSAELNITDQAGRTPLWLAAESGHVSILDKLFEQRTVDVNSRCLKGKTPLWEASARGYLNVVRWLLNKNADPDIPDNEGVTPLAKAEIKGQNLVIEAIRKYRSISMDGKSRLILHKRKSFA
jgi:ankyrin repeat protein